MKTSIIKIIKESVKGCPKIYMFISLVFIIIHIVLITWIPFALSVASLFSIILVELICIIVLAVYLWLFFYARKQHRLAKNHMVFYKQIPVEKTENQQNLNT